MQTPPPPGTNEQHVWGGNPYPLPGDPNQLPVDPHRPLTSHAGILASSSDPIFHPLSSHPLPPSFHYELPNIPPPNHHYASQGAYTPPYPHIPVRREHLSRPPFTHDLPHSSSSYNNPHFVVPPVIPRASPPNHNQQHAQFPSSHFPIPYQNFAPAPHPYPHQYVYNVPQQPPSLPVSRTLPSVAHIPILTSKTDFFAWDEGITSLLHAHGIIGHILDPLIVSDPYRPDRIPNIMPTLSTTPSADELALLTCWWDEDNIAQHVLTSRIGSIPRGLLPSPNLATRTALSIYQTLLRYYGTTNFADYAELFNSLHNLSCLPGRVQEYVSKWRAGISRLQSANFPVSIKLCVSQFIRGLPVIAAFNTLRAALPTHIAQAADHDYGAFVTITESALELDTIFKSAVHFLRPSRPPNIRTQDSSSRSSIVSAVPDSTKPTVVSSAPAAISAKICTNCGRRGHLVPTCFEPGGGMEGRHDEYKCDKGKYMAMLAASLEEACNMTDNDPAEEAVDDLPPNTLDDPTIPATDPISSSVS